MFKNSPGVSYTQPGLHMVNFWSVTIAFLYLWQPRRPLLLVAGVAGTGALIHRDAVDCPMSLTTGSKSP